MRGLRKLTAFTSQALAWSVVIMALSGVVLFVVPAGRVAHWVDWRFMGLNKDQWIAVHTIIGFTSLFLALLHILINIRPLWSYIKRRRLALGLATGLSLVFFAGSGMNLPPFSWIMQLGDNLSAAQETENPPVPHAEAMSLERLGGFLGYDPDTMVQRLRAAGYQVHGPHQTLKEIGQSANKSPAEVFKDMGLDAKKSRGKGRNRAK